MPLDWAAKAKLKRYIDLKQWTGGGEEARARQVKDGWLSPNLTSSSIRLVYSSLQDERIDLQLVQLLCADHPLVEACCLS